MKETRDHFTLMGDPQVKITLSAIQQGERTKTEIKVGQPGGSVQIEIQGSPLFKVCQEFDPKLHFPVLVLRMLNWVGDDRRRANQVGLYWIRDGTGRFYSNASILAGILALKRNSVCADLRKFGFKKEKAAIIPDLLEGKKRWKIRCHPDLYPDSTEGEADMIKWQRKQDPSYAKSSQAIEGAKVNHFHEKPPEEIPNLRLGNGEENRADRCAAENQKGTDSPSRIRETVHQGNQADRLSFGQSKPESTATNPSLA
jgi:hypothetical protein